MKKLCKHGFKVSSVDEKALQHYLLVTPLKWSQDALIGMINKAVKTIMRDWFEKYKETQTGNITADYSVIIPAIVSMTDFKISKLQIPESCTIKRTEKPSKEIWEGGFDIEDYEEMALFAMYEDPEAMLDWFMENKIYQRRKAFVKEKEMQFINEKKPFPANQDDFIDFACNEAGYKNRKQSEE
ncbi:hypothetical protein LCGC14_2721700 [marine sediment metagenome]|uniref:Uncharacterized protein n=1 Tax=marine sediment metagenome TaxID=412755 RepID=A0A0F8ZA06_9ZZZZ